jgi:hypothetical protein
MATRPLIWAIGFNHQFEDMSLVDRARGDLDHPGQLSGRDPSTISRGRRFRPFAKGGTEIAHAATFLDGLHCQEVIDATLVSREAAMGQTCVDLLVRACCILRPLCLVQVI